MRPLPTLKPIPVPDGFERQPRWNPGLLREEDMTAMRPVSPAIAQYSGQSKTIQWASFERPEKAEQGQDTGGLRPIIANRSTAATEHASQDPRSVQEVAPPRGKRAAGRRLASTNPAGSGNACLGQTRLRDLVT